MNVALLTVVAVVLTVIFAVLGLMHPCTAVAAWTPKKDRKKCFNPWGSTAVAFSSLTCGMLIYAVVVATRR